MGIPTVLAEDEAAIAEALDWFASGMDFAGALHLASSGAAPQFATFDRRLAAKGAKLTASRAVLLS